MRKLVVQEPHCEVGPLWVSKKQSLRQGLGDMWERARPRKGLLEGQGGLTGYSLALGLHSGAETTELSWLLYLFCVPPLAAGQHRERCSIHRGPFSEKSEAVSHCYPLNSWGMGQPRPAGCERRQLQVLMSQRRSQRQGGHVNYTKQQSEISVMAPWLVYVLQVHRACPAICHFPLNQDSFLMRSGLGRPLWEAWARPAPAVERRSRLVWSLLSLNQEQDQGHVRSGLVNAFSVLGR